MVEAAGQAAGGAGGLTAAAAGARRALVTGAGGFVGRALVRHLRAQGWTVEVVLRAASTRPQPAEWDAGVGRHLHDGSTGSLSAIVSAARPDVVFHLASLFIAEHKADEVLPLVESNVAFGTQLLEAMGASGATRLVNTGTAWQHFDGGGYSPSSLYAATKQAFEAVLRFYVEARGLRAVTLKLYDTYGPGDERPKLIPALLRAVQAGTPLSMTPGENRIDFVHVDDVAEAYRIAAERLLAGTGGTDESYAVRSGSAVSLRALIDLLQQVSGRTIEARWGTRPYRAREIMQPWAGGTTLPGWRPRIPLEVGLAALLGR